MPANDSETAWRTHPGRGGAAFGRGTGPPERGGDSNGAASIQSGHEAEQLDILIEARKENQRKAATRKSEKAAMITAEQPIDMTEAENESKPGQSHQAEVATEEDLAATKERAMWQRQLHRETRQGSSPSPSAARRRSLPPDEAASDLAAFASGSGRASPSHKMEGQTPPLTLEVDQVRGAVQKAAEDSIVRKSFELDGLTYRTKYF